MKTKVIFKGFLIAFLFTGLWFQAGCVSMKKRPLQLWKEVNERQQTFDALIVPGVPFENGSWSDLMRKRVLWSWFLYEKGIVRNIIYSGAAVYSPYYESKIMGLYARQLGIPEEHIFYDTVAEHSTENIYYSYERARAAGFKTIALGTDPFQSGLTRRFTRKRFGTPIQHIPYIEDSLRQFIGIHPDIDPSSAYKAGFKSILQRDNFWKRTKGTFGSDIPWKTKNKKAPAL